MPDAGVLAMVCGAGDSSLVLDSVDTAPWRCCGTCRTSSSSLDTVFPCLSFLASGSSLCINFADEIRFLLALLAIAARMSDRSLFFLLRYVISCYCDCDTYDPSGGQGSSEGQSQGQGLSEGQTHATPTPTPAKPLPKPPGLGRPPAITMGR